MGCSTESEAIITKGVPGHSTGHGAAAGTAAQNPGNQAELITYRSALSQRVFLLWLPFGTE